MLAAARRPLPGADRPAGARPGGWRRGCPRRRSPCSARSSPPRRGRLRPAAAPALGGLRRGDTAIRDQHPALWLARVRARARERRRAACRSSSGRRPTSAGCSPRSLRDPAALVVGLPPLSRRPGARPRGAARARASARAGCGRPGCRSGCRRRSCAGRCSTPARPRAPTSRSGWSRGWRRATSPACAPPDLRAALGRRRRARDPRPAPGRARGRARRLPLPRRRLVPGARRGARRRLRPGRRRRRPPRPRRRRRPPTSRSPCADAPADRRHLHRPRLAAALRLARAPRPPRRPAAPAACRTAPTGSGRPTSCSSPACATSGRGCRAFADHYRRLGVGHFLVDRQRLERRADGLGGGRSPTSRSGTPTASYRDSRFGMLWVNDLLRRHGQGRWCVVVDPDEFLVYPMMETRSLRALGQFLEDDHRPCLHALLSTPTATGRWPRPASARATTRSRSARSSTATATCSARAGATRPGCRAARGCARISPTGPSRRRR